MASNPEGLPVALGAGVPVAAAAAAADEAADILPHAHAHVLNRTRRGAGTVAWTVASSVDGPGKTQIKPARSLRSGEADGWGSCAHTTAHRLRTDRERYQVQQTSRVLQYCVCVNIAVGRHWRNTSDAHALKNSHSYPLMVHTRTLPAKKTDGLEKTDGLGFVGF